MIKSMILHYFLNNTYLSVFIQKLGVLLNRSLNGFKSTITRKALEMRETETKMSCRRIWHVN